MNYGLEPSEIFDWSREPRTENERKIRQRWLDRQLATRFGCAMLSMQARSVPSPASDFAAALHKAGSVMDQFMMNKLNGELNEIIAELEAEGEL